MRRTLPIVILAMLLAAAIVAGCGDEGGSGGGRGDEGGGGTLTGESVTTSSLSREEYVKRVSAACVKRRSRVLPEMAAYLGPQQTKEFTPDEFGPLFRKVVLPALEDELEIVRNIGAPAGDEEEIGAILAAQEAAIEEVTKLKNPESFEEVGEHFAGASKTMKEYGFTGCVNE